MSQRYECPCITAGVPVCEEKCWHHQTAAFDSPDCTFCHNTGLVSRGVLKQLAREGQHSDRRPSDKSLSRRDLAYHTWARKRREQEEARQARAAQQQARATT